VVLYFIDSLQKKYDLSKPLEKNKFIRQVLEIITRINNPVLVNDYLNKIVGIVRIDLTILSSELKKIKEIMKTKNVDTLPDSVVINIKSDPRMENESMRIKYFLGLLMNGDTFKSTYINENKEEIKELLPNDFFSNVFETIVNRLPSAGLGEEEFKIYSDCALLPVETFEDEESFLRELKAVIQRLKKEKTIKRIEAIKNDPELDLKPEKLEELQHLTKELL
jgi:DNA primase